MLGLPGSISEVFKSIPESYVMEGDEYQWTGKSRRKFPVMAFDDDQDLDALKGCIPKEMFSWISANNIHGFGYTAPDGTVTIGYDIANQWKERLRETAVCYFI